jgi:hypothetical protein
MLSSNISFDAWNNTIASPATGSVWHGHNPDAKRIHERQVASLALYTSESTKPFRTVAAMKFGSMTVAPRIFLLRRSA